MKMIECYYRVTTPENALGMTLHNLVMSEPSEVVDVRTPSENDPSGKRLFKRFEPKPKCWIEENFISIEKDLSSLNGFVPESNFYRMSRPIMWLQRFLGRTAYQIDSGWMRYNYRSFPFAYAVFLAVLQIVFTINYREHLLSAIHNLSHSTCYETILFSCLELIQVPSCLIVIYSWFFEVPSIVKCYNVAAVVEKRIFDVFPLCAISARTRNVVISLIGLDIVMAFVAGLLMIYSGSLDIPEFTIMFMFNFTRSHLASLGWCLDFSFVACLARKLRENMVKNGECQLNELKVCQKLWMAIWKLSQNHINATAVTLTIQLISNLLIFVIASYGMIVLIKTGDIPAMIRLSPYFGFGIFHVILICESAHHAQYELGDTFLRALMDMDKHAMSRECIDQVNSFINTIVLTDKAKISLKSYVTVGRSLLVAVSIKSVLDYTKADELYKISMKSAD